MPMPMRKLPGARHAGDIVSVHMTPVVSVTLMMVSLLRPASDATLASRPDQGRGSAADGHGYDT